jgi:hypothetical protein
MSEDLLNWMYLAFIVAALYYACVKDNFGGIKKTGHSKRPSLLAYLLGAPFVLGCLWFVASLLTFGRIPYGLVGFAISIGSGAALLVATEIRRSMNRRR